MPTRLYIIGNGFDLAHGIPCSYQDFKEYCRDYAPEMYQRINLFYTDTDKLWSDFEKEMPNIDEAKLFGWATVLNSEWNQSWDGYYRFIDTIKEEVDYLQYLPYAFRDWAFSINIDDVGRKFRLYQGNSLFLSFNYTKVLERVYGMPSCIVNHIHGVADNETSLLIVGHGDADCEIDEMFDSDNAFELEACQEIKDLVKCWRKDTVSIIQQNSNFFNALHDVNEIFVLGHSMASVDMPYFRRVKECVQPDAVWTLSVYSGKDRQRKLEAVQKLELPAGNVHLIRLEDLSDQMNLEFH